jgi:allantoin racemase
MARAAAAPSGMTAILLINPNTSDRSLRMMLDIAAPLLPSGVSIAGVSAERGVPMIVDEVALRASVPEVVRLGLAAAPSVSSIVVAAFGDPGVDALRGATALPVVGIGVASIAEAAVGGRRFGIATTTPALVRPIELLVERERVAGFTGVRVPRGDPAALAADPARQEQTLARLVRDCIELDGAEAVIIGGGPLSLAARALRHQFSVEIIEPVPAAIRCVTRLLGVGWDARRTDD